MDINLIICDCFSCWVLPFVSIGRKWIFSEIVGKCTRHRMCSKFIFRIPLLRCDLLPRNRGLYCRIYRYGQCSRKCDACQFFSQLHSSSTILQSRYMYCYPRPLLDIQTIYPKSSIFRLKFNVFSVIFLLFLISINYFSLY